MPRPFRCSNTSCAKPLGQIEHVFDRHGKRVTLVKTGRHLVRIEWRLLSGRWAVCSCGEATRIPKEAKVISGPEV